METDRFAALTRSLTAPRSRRGTFAVALGGPLGLLGLLPTAAKKKKKPRSQACPPAPTCPPATVCPPLPTCLGQCGFHFHELSGKIICGVSHLPEQPCHLCETSSECEFGAAPHCVREFSPIASGQRIKITNQCGDFPHGVCIGVIACRP
jgi:hypothetical protein